MLSSARGRTFVAQKYTVRHAEGNAFTESASTKYTSTSGSSCGDFATKRSFCIVSIWRESSALSDASRVREDSRCNAWVIFIHWRLTDESSTTGLSVTTTAFPTNCRTCRWRVISIVISTCVNWRFSRKYFVIRLLSSVCTRMSLPDVCSV